MTRWSQNLIIVDRVYLMNKNRTGQIIPLKIRAMLALVLVVALLAGPCTAPASAQSSTIDLVLGGEGATPWSISNIQPGDSGTKTVTLRNNSNYNGTVIIWVENISETDGAGRGADDAVLDKYLDFNLTVIDQKTNLTLPVLTHQLLQSFSDPAYLCITSLPAGATVTLIWQWTFQETNTPQNDAQGDTLTFNLYYSLIAEEPVIIPIKTPIPEPAVELTATPIAAPTATLTPAPGSGLMVNSIPDRITVGSDASATSTSGAVVEINSSVITIEKTDDDICYVNIPVNLPEGEVLATYTDAQGTTFRNNQFVFTSFDETGTPEITIIINTENAIGKGNAATAKIKSMFLDVLEKQAELAPADLTNDEISEFAQSAHVLNQLSARVSASIEVTLLTVPENAVIHSTITNKLSSAVQTALQLVVVDNDQIVDDIAFVLEVEKFNLPNKTVLGEARITMKVSAEYAQEVGIENFRIYRFDRETGQGEMLETQFAGYDNEGKAVFIGVSPNGLSVFVLTVLERLAQPTVVPSTVTPTTTNTIDIDILGNVTTVQTDASGTLLSSVQATDTDGKIMLKLSSGSTIITSTGKIPRRLVIGRVQITPPENTVVVDGIYQMQAYLSDNSENPSIFSISSAAVLTIPYQEEDLPSGSISIFLSYYDTQYGWIRLTPAEIVPQGELSMNLRGPAIFSIMTELGTPTILEPFFKVSNLVITTEETHTGEEIAASVIVTNIGAVAGTMTLELKLDGIIINRTPISLESGENRVVNFNFKVDSTGIHTVEIAGLKGRVSITTSRNILSFILAGIFPIIIILAYRKKRSDKDEWDTGLKTKHWLIDE